MILTQNRNQMKDPDISIHLWTPVYVKKPEILLLWKKDSVEDADQTGWLHIEGSK